MGLSPEGPKSLKSRSNAGSGGGIVEEGQQAPLHQLGGLGERCNLPLQRATANAFWA